MEYNISPEETVSDAVISAISTFQGRDSIVISPLADTIDPDALNRIFTPQHDGSPRRGGRVSFVHSHTHVTVENTEYVEISPLTKSEY